MCFDFFFSVYAEKIHIWYGIMCLSMSIVGYRMEINWNENFLEFPIISKPNFVFVQINVQTFLEQFWPVNYR